MRRALRQLPSALGMLLVFTVLTGLLYPLAVTGAAQALAGDRADGSLVVRDGQVVGSRLLSQPFTDPGYFHPRPSAVDHDAAHSGASQLGPTDPGLLADIDARAVAYREENGLAPDARVPVDAVTASGSGLDPHISVANARLQAPRVARERGLAESEVLRLVEEHTQGRWAGVLGEDGVNVLELNLALDEEAA
ncbi:K(+)-transporting ATPase subunit C [Streptomonospora nanhaiensis]|uniref:Potassium-transporting ATPase KdpC subunit n=1 Tax=Streptomonospora nanhaiensis TaxID=1323731 RepID=A0A853BKD8_9ACTN|nr:K(+)-transporting ATPase subunit C [Streptomonospora nanhaiensis]MBV2365362.1 K(+)-transporting ATPase subunit C [Streptomonospora nanhaiensis]MBX9389631.1 K(+)-transporting ATPase subunit C [Streptomonospora nanhaiensis]NYI95959.1 K+-transporting ATPase ATPase C chain [Streptomonospora nanhaiensis]